LSSYCTLPDYKYSPTCFQQLVSDGKVSASIPRDFFPPKLAVALGFRSPAAFVAVPKATMHEYNRPMFW
jgi:hypothetical protein